MNYPYAVISNLKRQFIFKNSLGWIGSGIIRVAQQENAVGIFVFHPFQTHLGREHHVEILIETGLQLDLADDLDVGEVSVAQYVVGVWFGVDQMADWSFFLQHLAPSYRVDRLLRRIDHDHAVARLYEARVAAPEINFGIDVSADFSHRGLLSGCRRS